MNNIKVLVVTVTVRTQSPTYFEDVVHRIVRPNGNVILLPDRVLKIELSPSSAVFFNSDQWLTMSSEIIDE